VKVYLAGPFFTQEQAIVIRRIEAILADLKIECFSPSRDQPQFRHDAAPEEKCRLSREIYAGNLQAIRNGDLMLACIDDFDPGTIWEMGYARGLFAAYRIIAFTTQHHGLNLMLAESCDGFLSGYGQIEQYFRGNLGIAQAWRGALV